MFNQVNIDDLLEALDDRDDIVSIAAMVAIKEMASMLKEIVSQCDQGGENGKVFSRDSCIERARTLPVVHKKTI